MSPKEALENVKKQLASLKVQLEAESIQHRHFYAKYCNLIDNEKFEEAAIYEHFAKGELRMKALESEIKALETVIKICEGFNYQEYYNWMRVHDEFQNKKNFNLTRMVIDDIDNLDLNKIKLAPIHKSTYVKYKENLLPYYDATEYIKKFKQDTIQGIEESAKQDAIKKYNELVDRLYKTTNSTITQGGTEAEKPKNDEDKPKGDGS